MFGSLRKATAARPRVVASVKGIANLYTLSREQCEEMCNTPSKTSKKVRLDCRPGPASNCALPISLILEDGCEVANKVDNAENQAVLGSHGQVRSMCVTGNRVGDRRLGEETIHGGGASYFRACCIDAEHKDLQGVVRTWLTSRNDNPYKYDDYEDRGMGTGRICVNILQKGYILGR